jgi:hypothetical protein
MFFLFDGVEIRRNFTSCEVNNYLVVMSRGPEDDLLGRNMSPLQIYIQIYVLMYSCNKNL